MKGRKAQARLERRRKAFKDARLDEEARTGREEAVTVPYWFLFLAAVCFTVRAMFGLASLGDRRRGRPHE